MNVIAIETTGPHLGLAVYNVDVAEKTFRRRGQIFLKAPLKQSDLLFPLLTKLLKRARVSKTDIGLLIVDIGPGSFTGVRIGVASARALGQALDLPLIGVSSLAALTHTHKAAAVVSWLPALAGEVYYRIGDQDRWGTRLEFDRGVEELRKKHRRVAVITGRPHVRNVAEIGIQTFLAKPRASAHPYSRVSPLYLQPSWAERKNPR